MSERSDRLWTRYREEGDQAARAELLDCHLGLVHHCARELHRRVAHAVELGDLVGAGTLGLVRALESFDRTRGFGFSTYAVQRIRGAMLDELRSRDWMPRTLRARTRRLQQAVDALERRLGRPARPREIAQRLDVSLERYWRDWAPLDRRQVIPLHGAAEGNGPGTRLEETIPDPDAPDPVAAVARAERHAVLRQAIAELPARQRAVLALYYYEGLNLRQIGEALQVTESRISQIRTQALRRLRECTSLAEVVA